MKRLTTTLAVTAIAFASSALYLRWQLGNERERSSSQAEGSPTATLAVAQAADARAAQSTPAPAAVPVSTAARPPSTDGKQRNKEQAAQYLKEMADPVARAAAIRRQIEHTREQFAGFDRKLNLDPASWDRLMELMGTQDVERRMALAHCLLDPFCIRPTLPDSVIERQKLIDALVPAEHRDEMVEFRGTEIDRRQVAGLRTLLPPEIALSDASANELLSALIDVRKSQQDEMASRDQHLGYYSTRNGLTLAYDQDAATYELGLQSAQNYQRAVNDRVAPLLTPGQNTLFNNMQEDLMDSFRGFLKHKREQQGKP